jgi:hypothetical protein
MSMSRNYDSYFVPEGYRYYSIGLRERNERYPMNSDNKCASLKGTDKSVFFPFRDGFVCDAVVG